jgi:hypothetical protein
MLASGIFTAANTGHSAFTLALERKSNIAAFFSVNPGRSARP